MKKKSKVKTKTMRYEDGTRITLTDDDVPELTAAFFKNAKPMRQMFPELAAYAAKRKRGRPKSAAPKRLQSFKLSQDVIDGIRNSGAGYNSRVDAILREALQDGRI